MYLTQRLFAAAGLFAILSSVSMAAPITGDLRISGQAMVSYTELDFLCETASSGLPCDEATQGQFFVGQGQTGDFAAASNSFGWIKDLSAANQPIGQPFPGGPLVDFITLFVAPDVHLNLTSISPGDFPAASCAAAPAAGQVCTPPGSAFNLINNGTGNTITSTATFQVEGIGYKGSMADGFSTFVGTFSADFNVPFQQLLAQLNSNGGTGSVTAPYSARFELTPAAIPEPGTTTLMAAGFALVLAQAIRRRKAGNVE